MRCSSTNQFASFEDEAEVEDYGFDLDPEGDFSGSVRITRLCAECYSEAAEGELELSASFECPDKGDADEGHELTLVDVELSPTDEYQTHDRHGKPIKNYRYSRHYIGAEAEVRIECECSKEFAETVKDHLSASDFEDTEH
jgi:hypothetical protein